MREIGRIGAGVWRQWQTRLIGHEWYKQTGGSVAGLAAMSLLLIGSSCTITSQPLAPRTSPTGQMIAVPPLAGAPAVPAVEPDALTNAAENALHGVTAADVSAGHVPAGATADVAASDADAADAAVAATEDSAATAAMAGAAAATAAVDAPDATVDPTAPETAVSSTSAPTDASTIASIAGATAAAGWKAPNVARVPFDSEIEQWRPLVRQELARAWSEGRLTGGASKLDDDVVLALIQQESGGDDTAVSWAGAMGLAQVMPFTFADMIYGDESVVDTLSEETILDPALNVRAGIRYLALAMQDFGGNLYWSLSSYNAGIGTVEDWRGVGLTAVPPIGGYVETADYAPAILSNLAGHRPGLVVNVPAPMTDDQAAAAIDLLQAAGLW